MLYWLVAFLVLVGLPLFLPKWHWFRYYACYVSYVTTVSAICSFYIPAFLTRPRDIRNISWCKPAAENVAKLLDIKWEFRNKENIKPETRAIIVANHQSILDAIGAVQLGGMIGNCTVVARKEVFYVWPFGLAAWLGGATFIDRNNRTDAISTLSKVANTELGNILSTAKIMMFPEGTRNQKGGSLLPFKKGAFRIAVDLQVPIIPVVYSPYNFIRPGEYFGSGKMIMSVLNPIPTKGLSFDDVEQLKDRVRETMLEEYQKLMKESSSNKLD